MEENTQQSLARLFSERSSSLSPAQRKLLSFILRELHHAAFMNSLALAKNGEVSNSTVIRLARNLGFSGFPDFQQALQKVLRERLSSLERYEASSESSPEEGFSRKVLSLEHAVLEKMESRLSEKAISRAVDLLEKREHVFVTGLLANACLAEYMAYFLGILRSNVHLFRSLDQEVFSRIRDGGENAVAVVYSFPRYPRETQSLGEIFREKKIPLIAITDSPLSPLAPLGDILLEAPMQFLSFIDPCAGAFSLTHYLLTSFYLRNPGKMRERLEDFEHFASRKDLFLRKDLDIRELL
ncbi:MAG TPA: MurR/RpiR family transcriptional regulator [Synergistaceae bacterium]|nr:MurR/RpiR family transcriptional regulator [Synergistaceae bacterium]